MSQHRELSLDVNPGCWGCHVPHILGWRAWVTEGSGGRGWVAKHYYILSCTGSMFESGDFSSEIE